MEIVVSTPIYQLLLSILAILIAPLFAIQISKILEERKKKYERRLLVFQTLMMTRASRLALEHIRALNMIDVEFYGKDKKNESVVEAWKVYLDNLGNQDYKEKSFDSWSNKNDELFIDLMQKMATCLNYKYDKSTISKTSYFPTGHATVENELDLIRGEFAKILKGEKSFPIIVMNVPVQTNSIDNNKEINEKY